MSIQRWKARIVPRQSQTVPRPDSGAIYVEVVMEKAEDGNIVLFVDHLTELEKAGMEKKKYSELEEAVWDSLKILTAKVEQQRSKDLDELETILVDWFANEENLLTIDGICQTIQEKFKQYRKFKGIKQNE